jgi:psiF repeat
VKAMVVAIALLIAGIAMTAQAADSSCEAKAAEKHLAGAAKNSFMTKCEKDAKSATATEQCNAQAAEKKLHGAAKDSFTKKCITDASK